MSPCWALIETVGIPSGQRDGLGQHGDITHAVATRVAMPPWQDYMITAHWDTRVDGRRAAPLDLAAIVLAPDLAPATPRQERRRSARRSLATAVRRGPAPLVSYSSRI